MEPILWKLRTGALWRDIPSGLCPWRTAYNRFNRLSKKRLWELFFLTYEQVLMKNGYSQTEATSAVINIQAASDEESFETLGNLEVEPPPRFISPSIRMETRLILKITEGDVHDSQAVDDIIERLTDATYFIADKAYDSETIRTRLKQDNISPIIPKRKNAKQPDLAFDHYLYKLRHLVENTFARLKHFRSIATRYEKLARNYKSMLYLACTMIHCKLN